MFRRLVTLGVIGLAAVGLGAPVAQAHATVAFLCYSRFEVDPGVWPLVADAPRVNASAGDLMAAGYWSPFAEKTIPTGTRIGDYYLLCNLPASMSPVPGQIVTQKGVLRQTDTWAATHPGSYPAAA